MVQMKKNFIGLAVVAAVLAGCQTAPKQFTSEDIDIPGYGAERTIASVNPGELIEAASRALKIAAKEPGALKAGITGNEAPRLLNQLLKTDAEVKAFAKSRGITKFNENNMKLPRELDVRVTNMLLSKKSLQNVEALDDVRAKLTRGAGSEYNVQAGKNSELLTQSKIGGKSSSKVTSEVSRGLPQPSAIIKGFKDGNPELATKDGGEILQAIGVENKKQYLLSIDAPGGPLVALTPESCVGKFNVEENTGFSKLLKRGNEEMTTKAIKNADGKPSCPNAAEVVLEANVNAQMQVFNRTEAEAIAASRALISKPCNANDRRIAEAKYKKGSSCALGK